MKVVTITLRGDIPREVIEDWGFDTNEEGGLYSGTFGEHVQVQSLRKQIEKAGSREYEMYLAFAALEDTLMPITIDLENSPPGAAQALESFITAMGEDYNAEVAAEVDESTGSAERFMFWRAPEFNPRSEVESNVSTDQGESNV